MTLGKRIAAVTAFSFILIIYYQLRIPSENSTTAPIFRDTISEEISKTGNLTGERKMVAIVTRARSGSTWFGSLFQLSEDVLYAFEPLDQRFVISKDYERPSVMSTSSIQLEILSRLCSCDFVHGFNTFGVQATVPSSYKSSKDVAKYNLPTEMEKGVPHMENFCENFPVVMLKCIRLSDLHLFQDLKNHGCSDWQVVHLIRDPRAVMRSQYLTFSNIDIEATESIRSAAVKLCSHGLNIYEQAKQDWLQDRYYLVKYEDLVAHPNSTVHELYSFIGIPVSEAVTEFVRSSSHGQSTDDGDYEIVKDSKKVSEKWKTWDLKIINTIEEACSDFMIVFGYDVFVTTNIN